MKILMMPIIATHNDVIKHEQISSAGLVFARVLLEETLYNTHDRITEYLDNHLIEMGFGKSVAIDLDNNNIICRRLLEIPVDAILIFIPDMFEESFKYTL